MSESVVMRFHYTVAEVGQDVIEDSRNAEPLSVLVGAGSILPGLDRALVGKSVGDHVSVVLPAAEAYGEHNPALVQRISKKHVPAAAHKPGATATLQTQGGPRVVTVLKVGLSVLDVDFNHPLVGKDLSFEIDVLETRPATAEEVLHGHAHGEGGVNH